MKNWKRMRDLLIEIVVAIVVVTAFVAYLLKLPPGTRANLQPVAFALNTATVFGLVFWWFRRLLKRPAFWVVIAILLAIQVGIYYFVISRISELPGVSYVLLDTVEWAFCFLVLSKLGSEKQT
jgi:hypothetical protein